MSHLHEYSSGTTTTTSPTTIPFTASGAVGDTVYVGVMTSATASAPLWSGSDNAGGAGTTNVWTRVSEVQVTGQTMYLTIFKCDVTKAWTTMTLTLASSHAGSRTLAQAQHFSDSEYGSGGTAKSGDNAGAAWSAVTSGLYTPTAANSLNFAVLGLVSPGRVWTPNAAWSGGTQLSSSIGTSDRGMATMWRTLTPASAIQANGTLNSSAIAGILAAQFDLTAPTPPAGAVSTVWNGTTWVAAVATKVWDGAAWNTIVGTKTWSGSAWV